MTKNLTSKQAVQAIAAADRAERLGDRVERIQQDIAIVHGEVEAMRWPLNLIGKMGKLLEERNYNAIKEQVAKWTDWIESSNSIHNKMERIIIMIEGFVEDYENTEINL